MILSRNLYISYRQVLLLYLIRLKMSAVHISLVSGFSYCRGGVRAYYKYAGFPYTFSYARQNGHNFLSSLTIMYNNPFPFFLALTQTGQLFLQKSAIFSSLSSFSIHHLM